MFTPRKRNWANLPKTTPTGINLTEIDFRIAIMDLLTVAGTKPGDITPEMIVNTVTELGEAVGECCDENYTTERYAEEVVPGPINMARPEQPFPDDTLEQIQRIMEHCFSFIMEV